MQPTKIRVISHLVVRWTILLAVLAFVTREFYAHVFVSKVHPSVHSLCPMGGLESLLRYITADGATLAKIFSGTMGLFFVSVGISLLFKRAFCGTICPLGTLQAIPGAAGKKIFGAKRFVIPAKLDRWLRLLKYPVLILTVFMAVATGTLWIQTFDPWAAYSHIFSPPELFGDYAIGFGILVAEFKAMYGLPANFFDGNRSGKIEDAIPFAKMAEMNGTDTATIKTALGLGADIADDTPWGTVYGSVRLEKIAEQNGVTVDQFKDRFGLGKNVGPDTPWRDVKKQVLKAAARLQPMESCEHE